MKARGIYEKGKQLHEYKEGMSMGINKLIFVLDSLAVQNGVVCFIGLQFILFSKKSNNCKPKIWKQSNERCHINAK